MPNWSNWSGGVQAQPSAILSPDSDDALQAAVAEATGPVRVVGTGHSFTPICATDGTLLQLDDITGVTSIDGNLATIRAGTKISAMGKPLWDAGLSLINQGDIDSQAIAGAIGTGTHGTGRRLGSLSSALRGARLVLADGSMETIGADDPRLPGIAVSMGLMGVMADVTLECRPRYGLIEKQWAMDVEEGLNSFPGLADYYRHIEIFWFPFADKLIVKVLEETEAPEQLNPEAESGTDAGDVMMEAACTTVRFFPETAAAIQTALMDKMPMEPEEERRGPAFQIFPSPRETRFNEMEYAVPADDGPAVARQVAEAIRASDIPVMFPLELRYTAADDCWLSPFYGRPGMTIAVHQYGPQNFKPLFDLTEPILKEADGRPHPGKRHTLTANDFADRYPLFGDFCQLREQMDPKGKFLTPYFGELLGV